MAFQPFGFRFEVSSSSRPIDVKATIRSRMREWYDPKRGARGWICGPFICLWLSAFDRHGPMLFGKLTHDAIGTRIAGRAGSDLNGLFVTLLFLPMLAFMLVITLIGTDPSRWNEGILYGGLTLLLLGFLWLHQKDRGEAEPLVRFLQDMATPGTRMPTTPGGIYMTPLMTGLVLTVDGDDQDGPVSAQMIEDALRDIAQGGFAILSLGPENYVQTLADADDGAFKIEFHPAPGMHFEGVRRERREDKNFTMEEALAAFRAFGAGTEPPDVLDWQPATLRF